MKISSLEFTFVGQPEPLHATAVELGYYGQRSMTDFIDELKVETPGTNFVDIDLDKRKVVVSPPMTDPEIRSIMARIIAERRRSTKAKSIETGLDERPEHISLPL